MVVCWVRILLLFSILDSILSQCNENCVNEYQSLLRDIKENAKILFVDILSKYGGNEELEKSLRELDELLNITNEGINKVENINEELMKSNDKLKTKILESEEELTDLSRIVKDMKLSDINMLLRNTSRPLNTDIHLDFVSEEDFVKMVNELTTWYRFLENSDSNISDADMTNIPNNVHDNLYMLEILLDNVDSKNCYEKLQDDLKLVLKDLSKLLNFGYILNDVLLLEENSRRDKDIADGVLNQTEDILNKEKELLNILLLMKDSLNIAKETDAVGRLIDELMKNKQSTLFQSKLNELNDQFNSNLNQLLKKYEVENYWKLLDELEDISIQVNEKNGSIPEVEKYIEESMNDIECYTQFIANCRYRTPLESTDKQNSPECDKKIKSLSFKQLSWKVYFN